MLEHLHPASAASIYMSNKMLWSPWQYTYITTLIRMHHWSCVRMYLKVYCTPKLTRPLCFVEGSLAYLCMAHLLLSTSSILWYTSFNMRLTKTASKLLIIIIEEQLRESRYLNLQLTIALLLLLYISETYKHFLLWCVWLVVYHEMALKTYHKQPTVHLYCERKVSQGNVAQIFARLDCTCRSFFFPFLTSDSNPFV